MNTVSVRLSALVLILLAASGAQAEYRCNPAPTALDRRACEAAKQGPDALRQFVQRVRPIQSLDMNHYVNEATLLSWQQMEQEQSRVASVKR
jgi:hypothetical protein